MINIDWKGIYPAVTTKFTDDDRLDMDAFGKNIEAQLEAGVSGIILGGTLGEASSLSKDEKQQILKYTLELITGRVPVVLNIAEQTTKEAISFAGNARENGANGLMLLPPMRYHADARETLSYFSAVADSTELPIMIYNNPVDYKVSVDIEMFKTLSDIPNIVAIKESSRDVTYLTRLKIAFGDRFRILSGVDNLALESLLMGADGWVAGLVCAFPHETVAIYKLVKAGRTKEAIAIYRWFIPLLELDVSSKLVQNIKLAETITGLGTENVRPPRLPLTGEERERVLKIINTSLESRPELPDYKNL